eukprot:9471663-Pyramimonas_sp.AAC.1
MLAHPSHASWPHRELHGKPKWRCTHALSMGPPTLPPPADPPAVQAQVFLRCGWSAMQVSEQGLPLRAACGPLPEARQTVGRPGRYAVFQGLMAYPHVRMVVSDLAGRVREANSWTAQLGASAGKHADVRGEIFST